MVGWQWPQWIAAVWLVLGLVVVAASHGKPKVHTSGPDEGKPFVYNFHARMMATAIIVFVLYQGGFF